MPKIKFGTLLKLLEENVPIKNTYKKFDFLKDIKAKPLSSADFDFGDVPYTSERLVKARIIEPTYTGLDYAITHEIPLKYRKPYHYTLILDDYISPEALRMFDLYANAMNRKRSYLWYGFPEKLDLGWFGIKHNNSAVFGFPGDRSNIFKVSHFSPTSLKEGYELIKNIGKSTLPTIFTVTDDLAPMLEKSGFKQLTEIPLYFDGLLVNKKVMLNSSVTPKDLLAELLYKLDTKSIDNETFNYLKNIVETQFPEFSELELLLYNKNKPHLIQLKDSAKMSNSTKKLLGLKQGGRLIPKHQDGNTLETIGNIAFLLSPLGDVSDIYNGIKEKNYNKAVLGGIGLAGTFLGAGALTKAFKAYRAYNKLKKLNNTVNTYRKLGVNTSRIMPQIRREANSAYNISRQITKPAAAAVATKAIDTVNDLKNIN